MISIPNIFPVTSHTNHVGPGSIFVAIKGSKEDGVRYIILAIQKGAKKIVIQQNTILSNEIRTEIKKWNIDIITVKNCRKALAQLSQKAAGNPAKKMHIIGITGTKGKTSTTLILEHILKNAGHKTALTSTVYNKIIDQKFVSNLTTGLPDYLHQFLKLCADSGVRYVIIETAAQALSLYRVHGIKFDCVVFTNFSKEHGEFYPTMNQYFKAKSKIFKQLKPNCSAIINADDPWGKKIVKNNSSFVAFGTDKGHSFSFEKINNYNASFILFAPNNAYKFNCPNLIGKFNCYNLAAASIAANMLGIPFKLAARSMLSFIGVPGRLEAYNLKNGACCFIDYAHNPSSFEAVLNTLRPHTDHLIVLFGAGGEKDLTKRPIMGKITSQIADLVILTSDNPRSEKPEIIIEQIYSGIDPNNNHKIIKEVDRKQAIKIAYKLSRNSSIIALLGKGPDEYQIIGNIKHKFSEKEIIQNLQ